MLVRESRAQFGERVPINAVVLALSAPAERRQDAGLCSGAAGGCAEGSGNFKINSATANSTLAISRDVWS